MPKRTEGPTLGSEEEFARVIAELREARGWSYETLADKMTAAGHKMHPTGIYKSEKEGRRITLDEAIAYAEAFDASSLDQLLRWSHERLQTEAYWREYKAAERMCTVAYGAQSAYRDMVRTIALQVQKNPDLRRRIEAERDRAEASLLREVMRYHDPRADTPEGRQELVAELFNNTMRTAADVLDEADRSER